VGGKEEKLPNWAEVASVSIAVLKVKLTGADGDTPVASKGGTVETIVGCAWASEAKHTHARNTMIVIEASEKNESLPETGCLIPCCNSKAFCTRVGEEKVLSVFWRFMVGRPAGPFGCSKEYIRDVKNGLGYPVT